jgi:hypothetical protein
VAPGIAYFGKDTEVSFGSNDPIKFLYGSELLRFRYVLDGVAGNSTIKRLVSEGKPTNISQAAEVRLPQLTIGLPESSDRHIDADTAPEKPREYQVFRMGYGATCGIEH